MKRLRNCQNYLVWLAFKTQRLMNSCKQREITVPNRLKKNKPEIGSGAQDPSQVKVGSLRND